MFPVPLVSSESGHCSAKNNSSLCRSDDLVTSKLDYGKIKRDVTHGSSSARERALLLQALRWTLTKCKTDFKRDRIIECYIGSDLLGCRSDHEQRAKIFQQLSAATGDASDVKEDWVRLINTVASFRRGTRRTRLLIIDDGRRRTFAGRTYLALSEPWITSMQRAVIAEQSDTRIKQHLLAALQKLSLKYESHEGRDVQGV